MLERLTQITPAFDRRAEGYGIGSATLRMVLKGPDGAIQFVMSTACHLPHVHEELVARGYYPGPYASDIGYHSPIPQYDDQTLMQDACEYLNGRPCYYDGSSLNADPILDTLLREGSEAVWAELERRYAEMFGARS